MQAKQSRQFFMEIYQVEETIRVPLGPVIHKAMKEVLKYITSLIGFSSSIFLYRFPVSSFNRLNFVDSSVTLKSIIDSFGNVCFTFNNKQYVEQHILTEHLSNSTNNMSLVLQSCQNGRFSFDRYKIDSKGKLNFVKCLANRLGPNVYVQYYGLRVFLREFQDNELILNTVGRFIYDNQTIVLTCDDCQQEELYMTARDASIIDFSAFYLAYIEGIEWPLVIDREADWKAVLFMLSLIFKVNLIINDTKRSQETDFSIPKSCNQVFLSKQNTKISISPPLNSCYFVGQTRKYLVFLQQSYKIHLYSNQPPFQHINSAILNSSSSLYLQEDMPILLDEKLIMFNITIHGITLKYYSLPLAELSYAQSYKWNQDYGQVQTDVLDVISVPVVKKKNIRIFYVYAPNDYIQVKQCEEWKLFTSRLGKNINSDGSGLISLQIKEQLLVYNLKTKNHLYTIRLDSRFSLSFVQFFPRQCKMLLTFGDRFQEYREGRLEREEKKHIESEIYCYSQRGNVFKMKENMFQMMGERQMRITNGLVRFQNNFISFNWLKVANFKDIYCAELTNQ